MKVRGRILMVLVMGGLLTTYLPASTAHGCSCAWPDDVRTRIDQAPAVVVGTLTEIRAGRDGGMFGPEAIYRFQVEEWIKGELGEVIDVHAPRDGSACGIETPVGGRVGLFLDLDGNRLSSNLCASMPADALLASFHGPSVSSTGIPHVLIGGWTSQTYDVFDREGGLVRSLDPRFDPEDIANADQFSVCPGGRLGVGRSQKGLTVWDLSTLEIVNRHELAEHQKAAYGAVGCRDAQAAIILLANAGMLNTRIIDAVGATGTDIVVPAQIVSFGTNHLVYGNSQTSTVGLVDLNTGETSTLYSAPQDQLVGVYGAANPANDTSAVVITTYDGARVDAELFIYDIAGNIVKSFPLVGEAYGPNWIDSTTVAILVYDFHDWEERSLHLIDVTTDEVTTFPDWESSSVAGQGDSVYGLIEGTMWQGNVSDGSIQRVGAVADVSAMILALFEDSPPVEVVPPDSPVPTGTTVPPLTEGMPSLGPTTDPEEGSNLARITFISVAGAALVAGAASWLRRSKTRE